jgi:hypothetical protein
LEISGVRKRGMLTTIYNEIENEEASMQQQDKESDKLGGNEGERLNEDSEDMEVLDEDSEQEEDTDQVEQYFDFGKNHSVHDQEH